MNLRTRSLQLAGMIALLFGSVACGAESTPKKDVFVDPAAGEGFCLHSLFQSNMVLQRSKPIAVWGWSTPGEKITVTFAGQTATTVADKDRSWKVTLPAMEASSQPATMTIEGPDGKIALENILIGDVWVLGGQSNMERPLRAVENGNLEIAAANFHNIRLLVLSRGEMGQLRGALASEDRRRLAAEAETLLKQEQSQ